VGLKAYHDSTVLPIVVENVAQPQVLGSLQLVRVPQEEMALSHVHNMPAWHINIGARILSEEEVSFCGVIECRFAHRKLFNVSLPQMDEF
jgi:hypothetical protein